jgi:hypothetical protein
MLTIFSMTLSKPPGLVKVFCILVAYISILVSANPLVARFDHQASYNATSVNQTGSLISDVPYVRHYMTKSRSRSISLSVSVSASVSTVSVTTTSFSTKPLTVFYTQTGTNKPYGLKDCTN